MQIECFLRFRASSETAYFLVLSPLLCFLFAVEGRRGASLISLSTAELVVNLGCVLMCCHNVRERGDLMNPMTIV